MKLNKVIVIAIYLLLPVSVLFSKDSAYIYVAVLFFICFYGILKSYYKTGIVGLFEFKNYFLIHFFYIHGLGYFSFMVREELGISEYNHASALLHHALQISIIAILVLLISYNLTIRSSSVCRIADIGKISGSFNKIKRKKWVKVLVFAFGMFCAYWFIMGVVPFFSPGFHESGRTEYGKGLGIIETLSKNSLNCTLFYYLWQLNKKKRFDKFSIFYLLTCVLIFILNDERGGLIHYLLSIAFLFYYCVKPFSIKQYLVGLIGIVALAGLIGVMRGEGEGKYEVDETRLYQMSLEIGQEMAVEFDNYVETFNMFKNSSYLGGTTLIPIFTIPVPRSIFSSKDQFWTAGKYFKEYHGHIHIRAGERLTYIGELYMNWGYSGILIGMALLGWLMAKIVKWSKKINTATDMYIFILLISGATSLIAGDIASAVVNTVTMNIFIIIYRMAGRIHL